MVLHLWALHTAGQNNPVGILIPKSRTKQDMVPFHPYFTVKDGFAATLFLIMFAVFVFYMPERPRRQLHPGQLLHTPAADRARVVPAALLRHAARASRMARGGRVFVMFGSIAMIFALPWLDTSKVRSMRYRPAMRWFFLIFIVNCLFLAGGGA